MGENAARVLHEKAQHAVLRGRELHGLAGHFHDPVQKVHREPTRDEGVLRLLRGVMADGHSHTGDQLPRVERFDHVVVGAGVQQAHDLLLRVAHGEDDHGDRGPRAQLTQRLRAVPVGEPEVQENDVGLLAQHHPQALLRRGGVMHDKALRLEAHAQEAADLHLVVDHEHHGGHDAGISPSIAMLFGRAMFTESPPLRLMNAAMVPP